MLRISLEDRKDYIADIATKMFSEKGFRSASMQNIATKAEISKAGIYHYFKTKEDILSHILLKNTETFLEILRQSIIDHKEKGLSPLEAFKELIKIYVKYINKDNNKRQIVLRERHQLSGIKKKKLLEKEQAMFHLLKGELLKIEGLDPSIDPNIVSFLIISSSHWLGYWYKEGKQLSIDEIIEQNIAIILRGVFNITPIEGYK